MHRLSARLPTAATFMFSALVLHSMQTCTIWISMNAPYAALYHKQNMPSVQLPV